MTPLEQRVAKALHDKSAAISALFGGFPIPPFKDDNGFYRDMARAAIEAHKAALEDAGLVIVPREPTRAMIQASEDGDNENERQVLAGETERAWYSEDDYKAMIAEALK